VSYWRRRLQALHDRAAALRALLGEEELKDGTAPLDGWRARVELTVVEGDMLEAAWRLHQLQQALGERSKPLPAAGPRKQGPKPGCECGTWARCRARKHTPAEGAAECGRGGRGALTEIPIYDHAGKLLSWASVEWCESHRPHPRLVRSRRGLLRRCYLRADDGSLVGWLEAIGRGSSYGCAFIQTLICGRVCALKGLRGSGR